MGDEYEHSCLACALLDHLVLAGAWVMTSTRVNKIGSSEWHFRGPSEMPGPTNTQSTELLCLSLFIVEDARIVRDVAEKPEEPEEAKSSIDRFQHATLPGT